MNHAVSIICACGGCINRSPHRNYLYTTKGDHVLAQEKMRSIILRKKIYKKYSIDSNIK